MGRILALDYGTKRVGIAVTDPLKIIATSLDTIHPDKLINYLKDYFLKEQVELIVVGLPTQMNGQASESETHIIPFIKKLTQQIPTIPVVRYDERFTTKMAISSMIEGGYKKKDRQDKKRLDSISATLILQGYLLSIQ
ncbi:MAG: Holliday junction resolvase RuvX [Bacteroidia bacterium]